MKLVIPLIKKLDGLLKRRIITKRKPNFIIPYNKKKTYMERWYLIPRNKVFNIYLHQYKYPDPDYHLHDHPWFNMSLVLFNSYTEHTIKYGGVNKYKEYKIGNLVFRSPWYTHRISNIIGGVCRTLFITGPVMRQWGFHTSITGWLDNITYKEKDKK